MKHGTHPAWQLLPGDRLVTGEVVVDAVGRGQLVQLDTERDGRITSQLVQRDKLVEVNKPS